MKVFIIACLLCFTIVPASFGQGTLQPQSPSQSQQDAQAQPRPSQVPFLPPKGIPKFQQRERAQQRNRRNRKDHHRKSIIFSALLLLTLASIPVSITYTGRRLEKVLQNPTGLTEDSTE